MLTFTVPEKLRRFIRSHQRVGYAAMFAASSQTIKKLAPDPKHIGADMPGFFGVLHTWGRQMPYHPHIHYVVPGGALSKSAHAVTNKGSKPMSHGLCRPWELSNTIILNLTDPYIAARDDIVCYQTLSPFLTDSR